MLLEDGQTENHETNQHKANTAQAQHAHTRTHTPTAMCALSGSRPECSVSMSVQCRRHCHFNHAVRLVPSRLQPDNKCYPPTSPPPHPKRTNDIRD